MSEIVGIHEGIEAVRLSLNGIKIFLKLTGDITKWNIDKLTKLTSLLYTQYMKKKEELMVGEVNINEIIKKDPKGMGLIQLDKDIMEKFVEYANKTKLSYSIMPDINSKDNKCEIAFGKTQEEILKHFISRNQQEARFYDYGEYIDNGDSEEIAKIIDNLGDKDLNEKKFARHGGAHTFVIDKEFIAKSSDNEKVLLAVPNRENEYIKIPIDRLSKKQDGIYVTMIENEDFDIYTKEGTPIIKDSDISIITAHDYQERTKNIDKSNVINQKKRMNIKDKTTFILKNKDGSIQKLSIVNKDAVKKAKKSIEQSVKNAVKPNKM